MIRPAGDMRKEALGMMALRTEDLFDKAMTLSKDVDDNVPRIGAHPSPVAGPRTQAVPGDRGEVRTSGAARHITWSTFPASSTRCE